MNSNNFYKVLISIDRFYRYGQKKGHVFEVIVANNAVKDIPP